jgi:hypothetical protein
MCSEQIRLNENITTELLSKGKLELLSIKQRLHNEVTQALNEYININNTTNISTASTDASYEMS